MPSWTQWPAGHAGEQLARALVVALILFVAFALSSALRRLVERLGREGHLPPPMVVRLHLLRRWTIWPIAALAALQGLGLFASAWALISAFLAAVAIGFVALWSLLGNATSALILLAMRPFRVGDHIELVEPASPDKSIGGRVIDMNMMFATIEQKDGQGGVSTVHIPNSLFFQKLVRTRGPEAKQSRPFFDSKQPAPPS